jgi:hypothetical protein
MEQRIHSTEGTHVNRIVEWLDILTSETNADETPIHNIQQFQIVPMHTDLSAFKGIVLCNHDEHE